MASPPSPPSRHAPSYSREISSTSSTMPLMPSNRSPSSSLGPSTLRPVHTRADSQPLSWISPEDFDAHALFDAPIPRPMVDGMPRARSPSFASGTARPRTLSFGGSSLLNFGEGSSSRAPSAFGINADRASLSINYLPSKFSDALAEGGPRRRKRKNATQPAMARGGGVDAFKRGEARMPEDRDDLHPSATRKGWFDRSETGSRWTRFKWVLFLFNAVYSVFALVGLVGCLLLWLDILNKSDVIRVANRTELIFSTLAAGFAVFTSVFGWAGVMLNNRSFLAFYCFFLWISFAFLVVPGYITYRRQSLNLEAKVNFQWSEAFDIDARRRVQNALGCCGYFSPYVEASISSTCYARSVLPGCKAPYYHFERTVLRRWFIVIFSLAGFNIAVIMASLLCSNHVTYRFGKGMMPKAYRLNEESVAVIMDNYAAQLADEYGPEVAAAVMSHSRAASTIDLTELSTMQPMSVGRNASSPSPGPGGQTRYGTIPGTTP
ncbi:tetraspanin Tsp2, partial [Mycena metata]